MGMLDMRRIVFGPDKSIFILLTRETFLLPGFLAFCQRMFYLNYVIDDKKQVNFELPATRAGNTRYPPNQAGKRVRVPVPATRGNPNTNISHI